MIYQIIIVLCLAVLVFCVLAPFDEVE